MDRLNEPHASSSNQADTHGIHQREPGDDDRNTFLFVMALRANDVLKWLNIDDLAAVNSTCKQLQRQTDEYLEEFFGKHYARKYFQISNLLLHQFWPRKKSVYRFNTHFQNVGIRPGRTIYNHLLNNHNQKVHTLLLQRGEISELDADIIAKIVKNVKVIELSGIKFDGEMYETFLKHCKQMKHLIINDVEECTKRGKKDQWQLQVYPALEHVYWATGSLPEYMATFFKQNPNIRTFHAGHSAVEDIVQLINTFSICIDELHLDINANELHELGPQLSRLRARQRYKRLMVNFEYSLHFNDLNRVNCTDGIYCSMVVEQREFISEILHLKTLKVLVFEQFPIQIKLAAYLSRHLLNLEAIYLRIKSYTDMVPFILSARKMRKIFIFDLENPPRQFYLAELNKRRKKLEGATKIDIYLPEKAYIELQWISKTLNHSLIEIKRSDSLIDDAPFVVDSLRDFRQY